MQYPELRDYFSKQISPAQSNEWEFEEVLHEIEELGEDQQVTLLQLVPAVWPISQNLCHSILKEGVRQADAISSRNLAEWLRKVLFHYETGGLLGARTFMADSNLELITSKPKAHVILMNDYLPRLSAYAKGISGMDLSLKSSEKIYTDTERIYLPESIEIFSETNQNLLFYKFIIGLQCGFACLGCLGYRLFHHQSTETAENRSVEPTHHLFLNRYPDQDLARDIYQLTELDRVLTFLTGEYPGLLRKAAPLVSKLLQLRPGCENDKNKEMECYFRSLLTGRKPALQNRVTTHTAEKSPDPFDQLYRWIEQLDGDYEHFNFLPFMDRFNISESVTRFEQRTEENKKKFETLLARVLPSPDAGSDSKTASNKSSEPADRAVIQLNSIAAADKKQEQTPQLLIDNEAITLPDELQDIIRKIQSDLGSIPQSYVSAAFGISGGGYNKGEGERASVHDAGEAFIPYDEWDYRRQGYRKNWCSLRERELPGVQSDFIPQALTKYRGQLSMIKRQFEFMHTQERFARRQRSGDDIDLDALIDSLGDQYAGLPASENLFIRRIRDQRSISTLFLVDMSNSTEGWVGTTIKEALVLLCEAMTIIGDQYGIYGFSGMRRMRSEVYRIKDILETYGDTVAGRLAAIGPKEYTRMGPPIRHMISHFRKVDTKTRLLIILSDGKPEDYDDYKGQYAIEDTRKALAEARGEGIHPYCITIDRKAHEYLEHLFGRGNYAFIPKIELLPSRLTEIYRLLTR